MPSLLFILLLFVSKITSATVGHSIENWDPSPEQHTPSYLACSSGSEAAFCPGQFLIFILFYNQRAFAFSGSASEVRDKVKETIHLEALRDLHSQIKQPEPHFLATKISHPILTTLKESNAHPDITQQQTFFSNLANYQIQNIRSILDHLSDD